MKYRLNRFFAGVPAVETESPERRDCSSDCAGHTKSTGYRVKPPAPARLFTLNASPPGRPSGPFVGAGAARAAIRWGTATRRVASGCLTFSLLAIVATAMAKAPCLPDGKPVPAIVDRVIDGDTFDIMRPSAAGSPGAEIARPMDDPSFPRKRESPADQRHSCRIRLWGVDAPELKQPAGGAAQYVLSEIFRNRSPITLICSGTTYRRHVCRAIVLVGGRPADVGASLVQTGYAYDNPVYSYAVYAPYEAKARKQQAGVWRLPDGGVKPWVWRKKH